MSFTNFSSGQSHSFGATYHELGPAKKSCGTPTTSTNPNLPARLQVTVTLRPGPLRNGVIDHPRGIPAAIRSKCAIWVGRNTDSTGRRRRAGRSRGKAASAIRCDWRGVPLPAGVGAAGRAVQITLIGRQGPGSERLAQALPPSNRPPGAHVHLTDAGRKPFIRSARNWTEGQAKALTSFLPQSRQNWNSF